MLSPIFFREVTKGPYSKREKKLNMFLTVLLTFCLDFQLLESDGITASYFAYIFQIVYNLSNTARDLLYPWSKMKYRLQTFSLRSFLIIFGRTKLVVSFSNNISL